MKWYFYVPIFAVLLIVLWIIGNTIYPFETLITSDRVLWVLGALWFLVKGILNLALLVVILLFVFLAPLFLGGFVLELMASINKFFNARFGETGNMSSFQHFLVGAVAGLIIGFLWIAGVPLLTRTPWSWFYYVSDWVLGSIEGRYPTPPFGFGIVAAIEAWFGYYIANESLQEELRKQARG